MYDLLIQHATIVDGTGQPAFQGDLGIVNGKIVALAASLSGESRQRIDARGLVAAPGFLDAHTHDDLALLRGSVVPPKAHQGVTTLVLGNCGFGLAPTTPTHTASLQDYSAAVLGHDTQSWDFPTLSHFLTALQSQPLRQHAAVLLPHTPVRVAAMGWEKRPATEQEIATQEALVEEAMQAGALGLSLGLMYVPGMFTPDPELVRLGRVVARHGGVITSHMRGEGDHLIEAITEMLTLARETDVSMHISHLKVCGKRNWGRIQEALEMIAEARASGLDVTVDMYPYTVGSTTITQLLPPWILEGGTSQLLARLKEVDQRKRLFHDLEHGVAGWENQIDYLGWDGVTIGSLQSEALHPFEGMRLSEIAVELQLSAQDTLLRLLLEEEARVTVLLRLMDQGDVDQVAQASFSMVGSDGLPMASGKPHPRLYGTFPRFLHRYVKELGVMSLEQAVQKLTQMTARRFGLNAVGTLEINKQADIVLFQPEIIQDRATYADPRQYPLGIEQVIVAGKILIEAGHLLDTAHGSVIQPDYTRSEDHHGV